MSLLLKYKYNGKKVRRYTDFKNFTDLLSFSLYSSTLTHSFLSMSFSSKASSSNSEVDRVLNQQPRFTPAEPDHLYSVTPSPEPVLATSNASNVSSHEEVTTLPSGPEWVRPTTDSVLLRNTSNVSRNNTEVLRAASDSTWSEASMLPRDAEVWTLLNAQPNFRVRSVEALLYNSSRLEPSVSSGSNIPAPIVLPPGPELVRPFSDSVLTSAARLPQSADLTRANSDILANIHASLQSRVARPVLQEPMTPLITPTVSPSTRPRGVWHNPKLTQDSNPDLWVPPSEFVGKLWRLEREMRSYHWWDDHYRQFIYQLNNNVNFVRKIQMTEFEIARAAAEAKKQALQSASENSELIKAVESSVTAQSPTWVFWVLVGLYYGLIVGVIFYDKIEWIFIKPNLMFLQFKNFLSDKFK